MEDLNCVIKLNGEDETLAFKRITLLTGMNGIGKGSFVDDFTRQCGLPNIVKNFGGSTYWKWAKFEKKTVKLNEEAVDSFVKSCGGSVDCLMFMYPEIDLHPKSQSRFGRAIALLSERTGARIVVVTHSMYIFGGIRMGLLEPSITVSVDDLAWYHFFKFKLMDKETTLYEKMSVGKDGNVEGKTTDSFFDCSSSHLMDLIDWSMTNVSKSDEPPFERIPFKVGDETFDFNKITVVCGREGLGKSDFVKAYAMERNAETRCGYRIYRGSMFLDEPFIDKPNVKIVVFDHPENGVHDELQFSFGVYMAMLADAQDLQVVVETNSSEIINGIRTGLCMYATNIDYRAFTSFFFCETRKKFEILEVSLDESGNLSDIPVDFPGDQTRQDCRDIMILMAPTKGIRRKLEKQRLDEQKKYSKE